MQGVQLRLPTPQEIQADAVARQATAGGPPPPPPGLSTRAPDAMDQAVAAGTPPGGLPPLPKQPTVGGPPPKPSTVTMDWLGRPFHPPTVGDSNIPAVPGLTRGPVSADTAIKASQTVLPMAGSIAGGMIGARGGFKGATAGSGAGAAAGDVASMALETSMGRPPTLVDATKRVGTAAATGAASEVVGRGVTKVLRPFASKIAGKIGQLGLEAAEYLEGKLTPAQQVDSHALSVLENIVEGSIFGGGRYRQLMTEQQALLRKRADDLINHFGPRTTMEEAGNAVNAATRQTVDAERTGLLSQATAARGDEAAANAAADTTRSSLRGRTGQALGVERTGQLWQQLQNEAHQAAKKTASGFYDQVDEMSKGVKVPLNTLREFVEEEIAKRGELGVALRGGKVASTLKKVGEETTEESIADKLGGNATAKAAIGGMDPGDPRLKLLLDALTEGGAGGNALEEGVTFRQAHEIRSSLGQMIRDASSGKGDPSLRGIAVQLQDRIDKAMTAAANDEATGVPGLRDAYDQATSAWKSMAKTYEDGLLAQVADKEPRVVVSALIKPGRVDDILAAKKALPPEAWKAVQAEHLESLLQGKNGEWATGDQLLSKLQKLTPETLDAVYGKQGVVDLESLGQAMKRAGAAGETAKSLETAASKVRGAEPPPYQVVAKIIRPGSVAEIDRMRQMVGVEQWKKVQSAHLQSLLQGKAPDEIVDGRELTARLTKLGKETLQAAYSRGTGGTGPNEADGIWQLARVMSHLERDRSGTGKMYIQLAQAGAGANIVFQPTSKAAKIAGATLITPAIIGRIVTHPKGREWLTTGLAGAGTEKGARAAANIGAFLVREGLITMMGPPDKPTITTPGGRQGGPGSAGAANAPPGRPSLGGGG